MKAMLVFPALVVSSLVSLTALGQGHRFHPNPPPPRFHPNPPPPRFHPNPPPRHNPWPQPPPRYNPWPQPPPRYNPWPQPPPRFGGMWTCTANDSGWEEHFSGHSAYARSRFEAERDAMNICLSMHGSCYISSCSQR